MSRIFFLDACKLITQYSIHMISCVWLMTASILKIDASLFFLINKQWHSVEFTDCVTSDTRKLVRWHFRRHITWNHIKIISSYFRLYWYCCKLQLALRKFECDHKSFSCHQTKILYFPKVKKDLIMI